jgi:hypothetical protein
MTPLETRSVGFLTFHWCIIFYFKALGLDRLMGINAFSPNDFLIGGRFYNIDTDWNVWMENTQSVRNINDLLQFSDRIERWHNSAHMSIEMVTGTPMMDASINIYYRTFWELHIFINNTFEEQLNSYKINTNPNPNMITPFQVLQAIDSFYPNFIGRL